MEQYGIDKKKIAYIFTSEHLRVDPDAPAPKPSSV